MASGPNPLTSCGCGRVEGGQQVLSFPFEMHGSFFEIAYTKKGTLAGVGVHPMIVK